MITPVWLRVQHPEPIGSPERMCAKTRDYMFGAPYEGNGCSHHWIAVHYAWEAGGAEISLPWWRMFHYIGPGIGWSDGDGTGCGPQ